MAKRFIIKGKKEPIPAYIGCVTDIVEEIDSVTSIIQGVKKEDANKYQEPQYKGGNGTYMVGYPEVSKFLYLIVLIKQKEHKIDIRNESLKVNGRKRVTEKFKNDLKKKLVGENMRFMLLHDRSYLVDVDLLKL